MIKQFLIKLRHLTFIKHNLRKELAYQFDDQTTSFGKLRPVSSLLGLISQSQPKSLQLVIDKQFMMVSHVATICWHK